MTQGTRYDLIIVGGGINGCMLAREAAREGLRTALVERLDFGAGITSRSTRLIHGGLRYLESLAVGLVRESLRDRRRLLREFPGIVRPQPFLLPSYADDSRPRWYLGAGLRLYGALAGANGLPRPRSIGPDETLQLVGELDPEGLRGSFEYFDCQAEFPERLALEAALQAEECGADIWNHTPVTGLVIRNSEVCGLRLGGATLSGELEGRIVVNAAGAWVDRVLEDLDGRSVRRLLSLVLGSHIVVRDLPGAPIHAIYREARSDGRPFFIVPWHGLYLIGTTEIKSDDPDRATPTEAEIQYLIKETNLLMPTAGLARNHVLYAYCGARPLLRMDSGSLQRASRSHALVDHAQVDGIGGLLTMAGGKLTTAPTFAAQVLRVVRRRLGLGPRKSAPHAHPPPPVLEESRIGRHYGPRSGAVASLLSKHTSLDRPFAAGTETTVGELVFAVRHEKARTLGDILLRRTGAAFDAEYEPSWVEDAAAVVADSLGWSVDQRREEVLACEREIANTLHARQH